MSLFSKCLRKICFSILCTTFVMTLLLSPESAEAQTSCQTCALNAQDLRDSCDAENRTCQNAVAIGAAGSVAACTLATAGRGLVVCLLAASASASVALEVCSRDLLACQRRTRLYERGCLINCGNEFRPDF